MSRHRGGGYGEAVAKALPYAVQVADRWHLMENSSTAFLDAVRKSFRAIRVAVGATVIDPKLLTSVERLQYEGYLRREDTNAAILALARDGVPIKRIVKRTGHSRKLVRQVIRGERTDVFRTRQSSLDVHLPWLDEQWSADCRNGAELWRRLKARGFRGSLRVVGEWTTRPRRAETTSDQQLQCVPSAPADDHGTRSPEQARRGDDRGIEERTDLGRGSHPDGVLPRHGAPEERRPRWLDHRGGHQPAGLVRRRHRQGQGSGRGGHTSPWYNGKTEGQITKPKLVKRQMYGRAKIDLLEARLLGAA